MDANFRLRNQLVGNYSRDPGILTGSAYFVPRHEYHQWIVSKASSEDVSV